MTRRARNLGSRLPLVFLAAWLPLAVIPQVSATILWHDAGARVTHNTGEGVDILGGVAKRNDTANDALYFKFQVDPLSDIANEEYHAVLQLFEGNHPRLAVGNAPEAWGYSAWFTAETGPENKAAGEFNLNSSQPEAVGLGEYRAYELPSHNRLRTFIFKVQYVPGGDDLITVWLSPDVGRGASEESQPEKLTTKFKANASFDQIHLRHNGGGNGWVFSDMAIATSFQDFILVHFWQTWWFMGLSATVVLLSVIAGVRVVERRKFQLQLQRAEQERALERERARIAQDLHDDLGSSLTRLSLLSELLKAEKDTPGQVEVHAVKISQAAGQTVRALEEIVWALRPGSDTLQSLVEYIAHVAQEIFEGDVARCRLDLPADLPAQPLPPEMRHNIFLIVKEALTNALKHGGAKEVLVQAKATDTTLEIVVQDDGRGFDSQKPPAPGKRQGLGNMHDRAVAMGGQLVVESAAGRGTCVRLTVNFPARAERLEEA